MITTETNARQVIRELERRYDAGGKAARGAMEKRLGRTAGEIARLSQQKVPQLFKDLLQSMEVERTSKGWRIRYGGLASKYAHYQHETKGLKHSGARRGKYVYRGDIAAHEGEPNPPRGSGIRTGAYKTKGGNVRFGHISAAGVRAKRTGEWWTRKSVHYAKRYPASKFPLVGQDHFLFGASNSAFEELWPRELIAIANAGQAAAEAVFS